MVYLDWLRVTEGELDGSVGGKSMKVLVVGATGFLGMSICAQLIEKRHTVRGIARPTADKSKVDRLRKMGVELVAADLRDAHSLEAACRGMDAVISTASVTISKQPEDTIEIVDHQGQERLIDIAKKEHVRRFVYISFPVLPGSFPLQDVKRSVERHLEQSGLEYTILRASFFMEVWLSPVVGFDVAKSSATIYGDGNNKMSWISLNDVATFAVTVLDHSSAKNRTIDVGGPEALSPLEVVSTFEKVTGRTFARQHVPESALEAQQKAATDPIQQSFAGLMIALARGHQVNMDRTLKEFPVHLTSVREYAQRTTGPPAK